MKITDCGQCQCIECLQKANERRKLLKSKYGTNGCCQLGCYRCRVCRVNVCITCTDHDHG